jgi:hypothetical protein
MKSPDNIPHEQKPQPYLISEEEFKTIPKQTQVYKPEDKITRDNFCNFLIYSFRISRGNYNIQLLFMGWLKARMGFDYPKTIANFIKAGGYNILSDDEKKEFENAFNKIQKHAETLPKKQNLEDTIKGEIEKKIVDPTGIEERIKRLGLEKIRTVAEFLAIVQKDIEGNQHTN